VSVSGGREEAAEVLLDEALGAEAQLAGSIPALVTFLAPL
jgi:hypothetical protein